jgi:hypothetical protein
MREKLVIILILSFNKKEDTLNCLKSVGELDYLPFEVIVVENGSTDGSLESIRTNYPNVHLLESKINFGVAGGRNLGIKFAEKFNYQYLLFLDNDALIDKSALSEMVNFFYANDKIGIVTPKCYLMNKQNTIAYAGGLSVNLFTGKIGDIGSGQEDKGQFDQPFLVNASGGLFLTSKEIINEVGLFDEKFNPYGWEDVDYSLRVRKNGYKIIYNPKAIFYHKGGKKSRPKIEADYERAKAKNYLYLLKKHSNLLQLFSLSIILPLRIMKIIIHSLFHGNFKLLLNHFKGFFGYLKNG